MLQQSLTAALVLNQAFPSDVQLDNYGNYGLGMENSWEISETIGFWENHGTHLEFFKQSLSGMMAVCWRR